MTIIKQKLRPVAPVIALFLITRLAIYTVTYFGLVMFKFVQIPTVSNVFTDNLWLNGFTGWDAGFYIKIATEGYSSAQAAFFPAYPLLIKIFSLIFRDPYIAGLFVSNLAFLIAIIFLYKIITAKFDKEVAWRTILYLSIFPTSFFFAAVLTESTFLMFAVLSFYFAEKEKWVLASLFGGLTALTRSVGLLIAAPLFLLYLIKKNYDFKKVKLDLLPVILIPLALCLFMLILVFYGKAPLAFVLEQGNWGRSLAFPLWDLLRAFKELTSYNTYLFLAGNYPVKLLAHFILTTAFLVISGFAFKKINPAYGLFALLLILVPLSTPSVKYLLYSNLRFILVAFPVFIVLAQWGKDRLVNLAIIVFSLLFLSLFSIWNGLGGWIS